MSSHLSQIVAARRGHTLASTRSASALKSDEWLCVVRREATAEALRGLGVPEPRRITECESFSAMLTLLAGSDMLAVVQHPFLELTHADQLVQEIQIAERLPGLTEGLYHHRGTCLEAFGNIAAWAMPMHPVYLWTLPLFHCNGWAFAWSTAAMGGTQVCLRAVDPAQIFRTIVEHGVTHMCGAPTVLTMLISTPADQKRAFAHKVNIQTGGSPPPAKVIEEIEVLGFRVLQIYGMTELQGPSTSCQPQESWSTLPLDQRADLMARQGVRYPVVESQIVADSLTCEPVPKDGKSVGEILIRSNTVMLGYFKDPTATAETFHGGWMHTGDLAVCHPDNYIEIKDRAKDIIISGGENISSVEVEIALYKHPATQVAAVVARADAKWAKPFAPLFN